MSAAPDNLPDLIRSGLVEICEVRRVSDGFRVTTQCMYPSNGLVQVMVRGGVRTVVVSDEGAGIGEAVSAGIPARDYGGRLMHLVRDQGLFIKDGVIYSPQIPIDAVSYAVLLVANASQDVARWLYEHTKVKRTRDFKALVAAFLQRRFQDRVLHDAVIVGHSNKPHKFANVVTFPSGARLIVDPAVNDPSSVNARVVANLDVAATKTPSLHQRIVYDDEEDWTPADLNLLQVGAIVVPFSRSSEVFERLASTA